MPPLSRETLKSFKTSKNFLMPLLPFPPMVVGIREMGRKGRETSFIEEKTYLPSLRSFSTYIPPPSFLISIFFLFIFVTTYNKNKNNLILIELNYPYASLYIKQIYIYICLIYRVWWQIRKERGVLFIIYNIKDRK